MTVILILISLITLCSLAKFLNTITQNILVSFFLDGINKASQIIKKVPNFKRFNDMMSALNEEMSFPDSFTLFAPTNDAIEKFENTNEDIKKNQEKLKTFLKGHIVQGKLLHNIIEPATSIQVKNLNNVVISINKIKDSNDDSKFEIEVESAKAVPNDIETISGLIFVIDEVIDLGQGSRIIFNPYQIISYNYLR